MTSLTEWQVWKSDKLTKSQNGSLTKWQDRLSDKLYKKTFCGNFSDKMSSWQNQKLTSVTKW